MKKLTPTATESYQNSSHYISVVLFHTRAGWHVTHSSCNQQWNTKSLHYSPYQLSGSTPVAILFLKDCHLNSFNLGDMVVTLVKTNHLQEELTSTVKPLFNKSVFSSFSIGHHHDMSTWVFSFSKGVQDITQEIIAYQALKFRSSDILWCKPKM